MQEVSEKERIGQKEEKIKKAGRAEKLVNDKLASSKDGMVYLNDAEFQQLIEAIKEEQTGKAVTKERPQVGVTVDLKL